jgi:mannose-6-phosphate isomerase
VTEADLCLAAKKSEKPGDVFSGLRQEVEATPCDVWLIPARVAHAIGAACLILEVQEPTDFTIQPERWCNGYRLSDKEMYLGLDREVVLSCFDLEQAGRSVSPGSGRRRRSTRRTMNIRLRRARGSPARYVPKSHAANMRTPLDPPPLRCGTSAQTVALSPT